MINFPLVSDFLLLLLICMLTGVLNLYLGACQRLSLIVKDWSSPNTINNMKLRA